MKGNQAIKEYLIDRGWIYKGNCNCSGMHTEKFEFKTDRGEYQLRVRAAHFLISKPDERFTKFSIVELKPITHEILKNYRTNIQEKNKI